MCAQIYAVFPYNPSSIDFLVSNLKDNLSDVASILESCAEIVQVANTSRFSFNHANSTTHIVVDKHERLIGICADSSLYRTLIRQFVNNDYVGNDHGISVSNTPHKLSANRTGAQHLISLVNQSTTRLPIIYMSLTTYGKHYAEPDKTARSFAGIAHVIPEPSRSFSIMIMEMEHHFFPYGGAWKIFSGGIDHPQTIIPFDQYHERELLTGQQLIDKATWYIQPKTRLRFIELSKPVLDSTVLLS